MSTVMYCCCISLFGESMDALTRRAGLAMAFSSSVVSTFLCMIDLISDKASGKYFLSSSEWRALYPFPLPLHLKLVLVFAHRVPTLFFIAMARARWISPSSTTTFGSSLTGSTSALLISSFLFLSASSAFIHTSCDARCCISLFIATSPTTDPFLISLSASSFALLPPFCCCTFAFFSSIAFAVPATMGRPFGRKPFRAMRLSIS
mmetsp:Transcript_5869/g.13916  ORF Transcript_5869/g.13916 Transcript_5869/m.13916 type:complete len:205 (+) Transcript_5869:1609-2223(+)